MRSICVGQEAQVGGLTTWAGHTLKWADELEALAASEPGEAVAWMVQKDGYSSFGPIGSLHDHPGVVAALNDGTLKMLYTAPVAEQVSEDAWSKHEARVQDAFAELNRRAQPQQVGDSDLLEWAVGRWRAEVQHRPLENRHRRSLDDTWRQMIRKLGADDVVICGPRHDELLAGEPK
jgi:hypothetical protein